MAAAMSEPVLVEQTRRIVDSFVHRGPDGSGVWVDHECGIALGHRRLAIIDISPAGAQPMTGSSRRWTISYNGEIYNHRDLRADLELSGIRFRGSSDTETLIEAFDAWGIDETLRRTEGMFAFGVWDHRDRRLTLGRDRFGEKPLSWFDDGRRLAFASEVRGLTTLDGFDRNVDETSVASMLSFGFVPSPASIYAGVRQLRPGHLLQAEVHEGRIQSVEREWWSLSAHIEAAIDNRSRSRNVTSSGHVAAEKIVAGSVAELDAVMAKAVAQRMQSDVPLGAFLSGGVDSCLVAALAQRALGATALKTFTIKMPDTFVTDGTDESVVAQRVAAHLGTDHTTVELALADMLAAVPTLGATWDEPFADPSMLPSLLLCRAASRSLTVCLGGDGGDEMFAGYNRHALGASLSGRTDWMPNSMRRGIARVLSAPSATTIDRVNAAVSRVVPERWRLANLGDKTRKAAALLAADPTAPIGAWSAFAGVWPATAIPHDVPRMTAIPPSLLGQLSPTERMMWMDTAVVLPDDMLVKVDRASMAASLEVRVPFLSPDVLAWSWRQPLNVKTSGGVGKVILRQLVDTMIPAGTAQRPKMGFDPPLGTWLRGPLNGWAGDLLTTSRCVREGWLDQRALTDTWREHRDGSRDWTYRLWTVLMLETWLAENSR